MSPAWTTSWKARHLRTDVLQSTEAADRTAWHIARVGEPAIKALPESPVGVALVRSPVDWVVEEHGAAAGLLGERPPDPASVLFGVHTFTPDGQPAGIDAPLIP